MFHKGVAMKIEGQHVSSAEMKQFEEFLDGING